jgi:hypothetical protein
VPSPLLETEIEGPISPWQKSSQAKGLLRIAASRKPRVGGAESPAAGLTTGEGQMPTLSADKETSAASPLVKPAPLRIVAGCEDSQV